ncbi:MAG: DNA repair protein RadC [Parcubacteria group bacterium]|nr:DNA repair protein RadC [Parcubacteria group bacterium]
MNTKKGTIKELPRLDRPREKLMQYGPEKLSDAELLAILLRSGPKGQNVVELSKNIFRKWGNDIANATFDDMRKVFGLGDAKACEIIACFELGKRVLKDKKAELFRSPRDVWEALKDIRDNKKEHFVVFFLDVRYQEIKRETISIGTLTESLVHPREVFEPAIRHSAAQILIAHNHPSGNPEPSEEDREVTRRFVAAGKLLGIDVIDHVIVTPMSFLSFKDQNIL